MFSRRLGQLQSGAFRPVYEPNQRSHSTRPTLCPDLGMLNSPSMHGGADNHHVPVMCAGTPGFDQESSTLSGSMAGFRPRQTINISGAQPSLARVKEEPITCVKQEPASPGIEP